MIYFDNSATTKPYEEVVDVFVKVTNNYFGNPSSIHKLGGESEKLLFQARKVIASILQVKDQEIIFTGSGTEGNNLAIKGIAMEHKNRGKHLITTMIEHASTINTFKQLEKLGFDVTYLPVNQQGIISLTDLERAIREDTILVSVIHVNNELGSIQPIAEIGTLLKKYPKLHFHVDHVQGIAKVPLAIEKCNIDLLTCSGHKFHGLRGTGFLYKRSGVKLSPLFTGGSQEMKLRAGTENVAGIVSMAKALRISIEKYKEKHQEIVQIKNWLMEQLAEVDGVELNTPMEQSAPHIINISILGIKPEVFIHALEKHDIYVSTKSACSSKQSEVSHVLLATGMDENRAKSAIRISFSYQNNLEEAKVFMEVMKKELRQLKKIMGS
ncbi:cysteine desulfurase NifS [Lottiidibacillus patelloidae]|uniref:Cysteine desulfurase NifS n=1 Tax=Lottiidibacillus patelloidae TaxID=2670334 RepID=A0A263BQS8_9BACI|nr:cysteine desulfurase family protein [Lottiidibacillus patelloidae]OZM56055.1 cysteine desulfurase NifS [Lottiidibacillus patelloidae]